MNDISQSKKDFIAIENNPCGRICVPFNEHYCFLNNTSGHDLDNFNSAVKGLKNDFLISMLAKKMCSVLVEANNLFIDLEETKDTAIFWKSVAEHLTNDDLTGLLTGKGLEAVLDELYKPEVINKLLENDLTARIVYADVNDLKKHNSGPGGHTQGDLAIAAVGHAIKNYIKVGRRKRIPHNIIGHEGRRNSIQIPRVIAARSNEKGDEFFIMSLHKKNNKEYLKQLKLAELMLEDIFTNLNYEYEGVNYEVSATFGVTEVTLPASKNELKKIVNKVDIAMMNHKIEAKTNGKTKGIVVDFNKHVD